MVESEAVLSSSFFTLDFNCLASPCLICSSLSSPPSLFSAALFLLSLSIIRMDPCLTSIHLGAMCPKPSLMSRMTLIVLLSKFSACQCLPLPTTLFLPTICLPLPTLPLPTLPLPLPTLPLPLPTPTLPTLPLPTLPLPLPTLTLPTPPLSTLLLPTLLLPTLSLPLPTLPLPLPTLHLPLPTPLPTPNLPIPSCRLWLSSTQFYRG
ncbi:hypothetical protein DFH29DRAFT_240774 [Suillus ampliporus]|nr:hypothetical protein DFH29DRAFT_240774 [Suillus ampliporus]